MSAKCLLILLSSFIFLIGVCSGNPEPEWWETAQIYQIWTRAFKDSDGDGEGDLQGTLFTFNFKSPANSNYNTFVSMLIVNLPKIIV